MRWTNFFTLGEVLWLSCLGSAHARTLSKEGIVGRQTSPPPGGFVWRGDRRSPREIRATGGFRPQGDGWENYDSSFDLTRHYTAGPNGCGLDDFDEPGFVFRTATDFPRVLAAESDPDSSGSESDSDSSGEAGAQRRLFNAADIWMDQTDGIFELFGEFPPTWREYDPREDIPGPDHPATPEAEDAQIGALLQNYIDMGAQELERLFPGANQAVQELFNIEPVALGCPSLSGFGSKVRRLDQRANKGGDGPQVERPEETLVEPSACNLEYIDVDFLLADERWAGTDHQLDLVLHGKFAKSASEPIRLGSDVDRGWHHIQHINLKEEFNAETISFKSIKGLELWSGKDELWVQDKFAGLDEKMSAKEWNTIWSGEIKPEDWGTTRCEQIDRLELEIQLRDKAWAGTDDALDLIILGEFIGKTSHTIHMGASDITGLELRSAAGDQIKLQSIKVTAKCADSPTEALIDHKWESISQWVKAEKESYGTIWHGAIEAKDWSWRPPCYEFDELKVAFHLVDAAWAGTDGLIQVKFDFDGPKTTLADNPNRDHRATIDINLDTVFGKKVISVDQVKLIDIWTGTDQIYIDSIQLLGRCAKSGKQAVFDRYKDLDTKMSSSSGFTSVWVGEPFLMAASISTQNFLSWQHDLVLEALRQQRLGW
ncbi:hypothetical protein MHUMG1_09844 [Metarhizium humberi]|uniref:Heat-labile enterotoxin IIB, A chain n=1 Tax=Metarhizium humberi TaxID=2596975 RepID=A0A9P8S387_9HYPO|nr:hypothetical protein MHUMG1_09844 [Metarhizium humberi]